MILSKHRVGGEHLGKDSGFIEEQAQEVCRKFLVDRYHRANYRDAKIRFDKVSATEEGGVPTFYLEGEIEVRGGTLVAQFLFPPDRYTFKMWVDTATGRVLRWEMN